MKLEGRVARIHRGQTVDVQIMLVAIINFKDFIFTLNTECCVILINAHLLLCPDGSLGVGVEKVWSQQYRAQESSERQTADSFI